MHVKMMVVPFVSTLSHFFVFIMRHFMCSDTSVFIYLIACLTLYKFILQTEYPALRINNLVKILTSVYSQIIY